MAGGSERGEARPIGRLLVPDESPNEVLEGFRVQPPKFLTDLDPNIYASQDYRVLDLETTVTESDPTPFRLENRIVAWVGYDGRTGRVTRRYLGERPGEHQELLDYCQGCAYLVCHFAKFELQWLQSIGMEPGTVLVWDTFLGQWVKNGNKKTPLDLDWIAHSYGLEGKESIVKKMIQGGVCPSQIPKRRLVDYCEQDVLQTNEVFIRQRAELSKLSLLPVMYTRCLTTLVLADIERHGMCLDGPKVKAEYRLWNEKLNDIQRRIDEFTGGINARSGPQKAEYLYDKLGFAELTDSRGNVKRTVPSKRFPAGQRLTDKDSIALLKPNTPEQHRFKDLLGEFSPVNEKVKNLGKMLECVEDAEKKGVKPILYATLNQGICVNHRLSSTGKLYKVQFQNIDRDFKKMVKTRYEDGFIGEGDAPQLEFRTAIHLTGDPVGHREVRDHFDVHKFTASVITKTPIDKVDKRQRAGNKNHTFKPVYGGKSGTPDQQRYYRAFNEKYHVMYEGQTEWTWQVLKDKKLRTQTGLIFYWPGIAISRSGYIEFTAQIFNYPVSSLATADIIPIALVYAWYRLRGYKSYLINTVHDSLIGEVFPDERDIWQRTVRPAFTTDTFRFLERVYGIRWTVPLGVEYALDPNWGCGEEEWLYEVDPTNNTEYEALNKKPLKEWTALAA